MRFIQDERGGFLVWILIVLATLSTLGIGFGLLAGNEVRIAHNHQVSENAFQIAEAGLNWAMKTITVPTLLQAQSDTHIMHEQSMLLDIGEVKVELVPLAEPQWGCNWKINSTGYSLGSEVTVSRLVDASIFGMGLFEEHSLALGSNLIKTMPNVVGDVYVEGYIEGQPSKDGTVTYGVTYAMGEITGIDGAVVPHSPKQYIILDDFDVLQDNLYSKALAQNRVEHGGFVIPETLNGETYYVQGDVYIPFNLSGNGAVFAEGNIVLVWCPEDEIIDIVGDDQFLWLFAKGNCRDNGIGWRDISMINTYIAVEGYFRLSGLGTNSSFYISGGITAFDMDLNGHQNKMTIDGFGLKDRDVYNHTQATIYFGPWSNR